MLGSLKTGKEERGEKRGGRGERPEGEKKKEGRDQSGCSDMCPRPILQSAPDRAGNVEKKKGEEREEERGKAGRRRRGRKKRGTPL